MSHDVDLGDFAVTFDQDEERRRREREAAAYLDEPGSRRALELLAGEGRPLVLPPEPVREIQPAAPVPPVPPVPPYAPADAERIRRVDERARTDPYAVRAAVEAGRDADPAADDEGPLPAAAAAPRGAPLGVPQARRVAAPGPAPRAPSAALASPVRADAMARKPPLMSDAEARADYLRRSGLPSDQDVRNAEGGDVARGIFGGIGAALSAFGSGIGGMPSAAAPPSPRRAPQLQAQQAQGLERGRAGKREEIEGERSARTLEVQSRRTELQAEHQARRDALAEIRAGSQARRDEARALRDEAATAAQRIAAGRLDEATSPTSAASGRARARYALAQLQRERLFPASERRTREEIEAEVVGLSAADVEALERRMATMSLGSRRRGEGGPGLTLESRAALRAEAVRLGVPEAAAGTMTPRALTSEIAQRTRGTRGTTATGVELIPGTGITTGGAVTTMEPRQFREGYAIALGGMADVDAVTEIARQHGAATAIDPNAQRELEPFLVTMRGMVADMGRMGVINEGEVPRINAALPNPGNLVQMTFGSFRSAVQSWRRILESRVRARARSLGVSPANIDRLIAGLNSGSIPAAEAPEAGVGASVPEGEILVRRLEDGEPGTIPEDEFDPALYERMPEGE